MFHRSLKDSSKAVRAVFAGLVMVLASMISACDITLSGPESLAIDYVRSLVEQPELNLSDRRVTAYLPNRMVIEYARALHVQGVTQKYRTHIVSDDDDDGSGVEVAVSIVPKRAESFNEREHTLIVTIVRDEQSAWAVQSIKTKH